MITRIEIDGFESFADFSMDVAPRITLVTMSSRVGADRKPERVTQALPVDLFTPLGRRIDLDELRHVPSYRQFTSHLKNALDDVLV